MKTSQILIAGFGGPGVLFAGKFLAYKGLTENMQVSWLPSYGPEMRGGTANCSVILSDTPVGSPIITNPDVLVAMNLPSLQKFVDTVVPGGKIFIDSTLIDAKVARTDVEVHYIPATQMAKDAGFLAAFLRPGDAWRYRQLLRGVVRYPGRLSHHHQSRCADRYEPAQPAEVCG